MSHERITRAAGHMGGQPCIRGERFTVGQVIGLVAKGFTTEEILSRYPFLQPEDIPAALSYAAGVIYDHPDAEPVPEEVWEKMLQDDGEEQE